MALTLNPTGGGGAEVSYTIGARDVSEASIASAKAGLQSLEQASKSVTDKMHAQWQRVKANYTALHFAVADAMRYIKQAWDMASAAAEYLEQKEALNALAAQYGTTADVIVSAVKKASGSVLSMGEAVEMATKAMMRSLDPTQIAAMTTAAKSLGDSLKIDVADAFERLSLAMATGRTRGIAQMGIIVDLKKAYADYAQDVHRSVGSLSAHEQQAIRTNVVMEATKARLAALGPPSTSVKDQMEKITAALKDVYIWMGEMMIRAGAGLIYMLAKDAEYVLWLCGGFYKLIEAIGWLTDKIHLTTSAHELYGDMAEKCFSKAAAMGALAKSGWDVMTASSLAATGAAQVAVAAEEEVIAKGAKAATSANAYWDALFMQQSARRNKDKEQTAQMAIDAVTWQNWQTESIIAKLDEEMWVREHNRMVDLQKTQLAEANKQKVKTMMANMAMNTIQALAVFGDKGRRASFIAEKAYALGTAMMNTALGITACLKLGYWGIPLAVIVGAMGAIQIAAIAKQSMEGAPSAIPETVTTTPTWPASTLPATTPSSTEGISAKATKETSISIIVQGNIVDYDKFARELLPAIRKAEEDHI